MKPKFEVTVCILLRFVECHHPHALPTTVDIHQEAELLALNLDKVLGALSPFQMRKQYQYIGAANHVPA